VQKIVNRELGPATLFVGNVGRPGHATVAHVLQVEKLLEQYEDIDAIMVLAGVNDLLIHLNIRRGFVAIEPRVDPAQRLRAAFSVVPPERDRPWYARSSLADWIRERRLRSREPLSPVMDAEGRLFEQLTRYRKTASRFLDDLPDLRAPLAHYRENLNRIVDLARASGVRPLLLTQPAIWRHGLPRDAEDRLWAGGPPLDRLQEGGEYLTVRALAEGMASFNEAMLAVCVERGIECIDTASQLPKESDMFTDDMHYTEVGSRRMAEIVAGHLLGTPPLAR
jgi:lysophospholipase L1-like esterase